MRALRDFRLGGLLLLGLAACGGSAPAPEPRSSALLITLDTTRPDAVDPYRQQGGVTPNLASLAAHGVVFDRARATAPLTLPSHASMLTGLYPLRHTLRDNGQAALPQAAVTVAERARAAGMRTGAFIAAGVLAAPFGLDQGFETYEAPAPENAKGGFPTRWAGQVTDQALAWLDARQGEEPFFLWVHYFDAHRPYNPPPRFVRRFPGHPYLAEVATIDYHIGRLLEKIEAEADGEQILILAVADHGEAQGANGELSHGLLLHDATLRVPLIVRYPGNAHAGERRDELVSLVDIAPTLIHYMGLPPLEGIDGLCLGAERDPAWKRQGVYAEDYMGYLSFGWAPLVGWACGEGLYVHGAAPAIIPTGGGDALRPAGDLPWIETARRRIAALGRARKLEREADDSRDVDLQSLGYAAGFEREIPPPLEIPPGLPDPRERLDEAGRIFAALGAADGGDLEGAIHTLEQVTAQSPRNAFAGDQLANLYLRAGRAEDAVKALQAVLRSGADRPSLRRRLAQAYLDLGDEAQARAQLEALLELLPRDPGALELLATLSPGD